MDSANTPGPHAASRTIHVIGGGIAGLAAALRARALLPDARITLFEKSARCGGKIAGDVVHGCVADGGADVCIGERMRQTELFRLPGLTSRAVRVNPGRLPAYQLRDGLLQQLPALFDGELLTFSGGMRSLVDEVVGALEGVSLRTGVAITALARETGGWRVVAEDGTTSTADCVIVATPAKPAAELLQRVLPEQQYSQLAELPYPATTTVTMAWQSSQVPHALQGTGYLVADPDSPVSACTWVSSKNPGHAPSGVVVLRCYIRGMKGDPVVLMRNEVASALGIVADPVFARAYDWNAGIPVYSVEHRQLVERLDGVMRDTPGLFIAGSAFHGVGIPDCILSGERAAMDAVRHLVESTDHRTTDEAA